MLIIYDPDFSSIYLVFFVVVLETSSSTQGLLQALQSRVTPGIAGWDAGDQTSWFVCKASTLSAVVLLLRPSLFVIHLKILSEHLETQ